MATRLASGYIELSVHYKEAMREIRKAINDVGDVELDFTVDTKSAERQSERFREKESKKSVETKLDVDLREAEKKLLGLRIKEEARKLGVKVDVDTAQADTQLRLLRAQNEARRIQLGVDVDGRGLKRSLENIARSDFLKINLGVAGIASLPALAAGLAEVASAMAQLSQAALVIPGGIAGAVSSIGTLAFGLTGVTDAYEALNKVADESAKSGRDAAAQARSQQSASYSLRNAINDEAQARGDVSRAIRDQRRDMQDLDLQMRGGITSEKRAILEAQKARERLYSGDFSDYREALLDVEEADLRVEEVRNRNVRTAEDLAEANAKGVYGSDRVVAANERLTRSQQSVVMAQGAVAAAADTTTAAQEEAELAMGKLSQNGQAFVRALMDVQGPIQTLRNLVQDNIFAGLDDDLRSLTGKAMPTFERGLGGIGDAWNRSFKEMFRLAGEGKNLSVLERIFGNTTEAQDILTGALEPLTEGLLTLTEAGTDALPRLADGFVAVSERFANFITAADEDGRLDEWIDEGITALGNLGETLLNLGKIFTGIGDAAQGTLLGNLEKWTTTWATWINSVEGQNTLKDFFAEGRRVFEQWRPILEDLPGIFKSIYDAASTFSSAVALIMSPITEILENFPGLVETAAMAFLVFKSAQVVGAVGGMLTSLTSMSTMLKTDLPKSAKIGGAGIASALSAVAIPAWLSYLVGKENPAYNQPNDPQSLQAQADALTGKVAPGTLGGPPLAQRERRGLPPIDPTGGLIMGSDPRTFAHQQKMPYWESKGYTVGDHAADAANEHQNGALDIMVPSIEEGNKVLQEILSDPNVYGAIFNNQAYGYGQGSAPRDYSGGFTGNDTQDHKDHVHVWYKPGNDSNITPAMPQVVPPGVNPAPPVAGGPPGMPPPGAGTPPVSIQDLLFPGVKKFDTGGWWKDGELGINTTGEDELVLNPDHLDDLAKQGVDPNALIHGNGLGAPPGPTPDQVNQIDQYQGQIEQFTGMRTGGYIPAAAGNTSVAGESFLSGIYGMGAEVINGLIDQAASAASSAAGMALTAGTFGAGAAGAPAASAAASAAIGMGTQAAKRGVEYGAQMLGILTDSIIEQATPFGTPRILTTDPTGFMPQQLLSGAIGKMMQPGQQIPGQPGQPPQAGAPATPGMPPAADHGGTGAAPGVPNPAGPPPGVGQTVGQGQPDPNQMTALDFLKPIIPTVHDQGGWLPPGGLAMNLTKKAEPIPVFNHDQWGTLNSLANAPVGEPVPAGGGDYRTIIENVTVKDVAEFERAMRDRQALQSMRYRGRPR